MPTEEWESLPPLRVDSKEYVTPEGSTLQLCFFCEDSRDVTVRVPSIAVVAGFSCCRMHMVKLADFCAMNPSGDPRQVIQWHRKGWM
jgi:hypothetical protein